MALNQPTYFTKRKFIRRNIILGIVFFCIALDGGIKLYHYYNRNPYLLELQRMVAEQYGDDFSVIINCSKKEKISQIEIEAGEEAYFRKDTFSRVDHLQKLVYRYVMQNKERFCDIDSVIPKNGVRESGKEGVELFFNNSDGTSSNGQIVVFLFYNMVEYREEHAEGFNSVIISSLYAEKDTFIAASKLINFYDVNYIQCWDIDLDDASCIKKMPNLKELAVGEADAKELKKIAREMGIECY